MLKHAKVKKFPRELEMLTKDYKDYIKQFICQKLTPACYLDDCDRCPGTTTFSESLLKILDDGSVKPSSRIFKKFLTCNLVHGL